MTVPQPTILQIILDRYKRYEAGPVSEAITPADDMFVDGNLDHYLAVGKSAIDVIVNAMVTAGTPSFGTILDLPCGGGRVTRHLKAFFPDAALHVRDIDAAKERFVAETFGATVARVDARFESPPEPIYDLIFVGSLLTHLDEDLVTAALGWMIGSLASDGLLVFTTHGRRHVQLFNHLYAKPHPAFAQLYGGYRQKGFGFRLSDASGPTPYGHTLNSLAWMARRLEAEPSIRVLGCHEGGWAVHQDVFVVQKRPLTLP